MTITAWPFGDLRLMHYGVILCDSPWYFKNYSAKGEEKNPMAHYDCMDLAAIKALPVSQLARPDAVCVMWATAPFLAEAISTMAAWGFAFKSAGAWAKQSPSGKGWAFGCGYRYRGAAEFWLFGTLGNPRQHAQNVRNLIVAPVREHSRKPDRMHEDIEAMWEPPYCELFARESTRKNWEVWGNQTEKFNA